jgi:hypothetical protein
MPSSSWRDASSRRWVTDGLDRAPRRRGVRLEREAPALAFTSATAASKPPGSSSRRGSDRPPAARAGPASCRTRSAAARLAPHLEDLEHRERRDLGEIAAEHLAAELRSKARSARQSSGWSSPPDTWQNVTAFGADLEPVAGPELALLDPLAVHERAVRAAEVVQHEAAAAQTIFA